MFSSGSWRHADSGAPYRLMEKTRMGYITPAATGYFYFGKELAGFFQNDHFQRRMQAGEHSQHKKPAAPPPITINLFLYWHILLLYSFTTSLLLNTSAHISNLRICFLNSFNNAVVAQHIGFSFAYTNIMFKVHGGFMINRTHRPAVFFGIHFFLTHVDHRFNGQHQSLRVIPGLNSSRP